MKGGKFFGGRVSVGRVGTRKRESQMEIFQRKGGGEGVGGRWAQEKEKPRERKKNLIFRDLGGGGLKENDSTIKRPLGRPLGWELVLSRRESVSG